MPNAAFTMVQNDMVILDLWTSYYSKYFDTLLVLGNGTKEEYGEHMDFLKTKYGIIYERLPAMWGESDFLGNSELTIIKIKEKQKELLETHEWVLYSDCDEYVVADPKKYKDLKDFMQKYNGDKVYCEGMDVYQEEGQGAIDYSKPYLAQRGWWYKNRDYNKPLLAKVPLNWAPGCHSEEGGPAGNESRAIANTGLFLLHLKYSDLSPVNADLRDFGPTLTGVNMDSVEKGKTEKGLIPKEVVKLF